MKLLNELIESMGDAEVFQRDNGNFGLVVDPKIVEDLTLIKEKIDSAATCLTKINQAVETKQDTMVGTSTRAVCLTTLSMLE